MASGHLDAGSFPTASLHGPDGQNAICIHQKFNFNLRYASGHRRKSRELKIGKQSTVLGHLTLALQHTQCDVDLTVFLVENISVAALRTELLRMMSLATPPPRVSIPKDNGMTSNNSSPGLVPAKIAALHRGPRATTRSGSKATYGSV